MKKQILFIHGATAFSDYNKVLEHLRTRLIHDPLGLEIQKKWRDDLKEKLAETHEMYVPTMPNRQNAQYEEWKIWFERHLEFLRDGAILIGHSQGGYFLSKYLIENNLPISVKALYLIAAPIEPDDFHGEDGGDFNFDISKLSQIQQKVEKIFILHSKDDSIVPFSHAEKYRNALPEAELMTFENRGHFLMEEFPELLKSIQNL